MLKIGVRYCGGCNPSYDRVAALEGLLRTLNGKAQAADYREEGIQALIFVCGCPTACPSREGGGSGLPCFVLQCQDEIQEAFQWVVSLLEAQRKAKAEAG